jgi:hypothetical protein
MLLTDREREFLAAFIHEATTDPFKGPATEKLHRRNIYYTDLSHLMTAYYRESGGDKEGFGGKYDPTPRACPWKDRDTAVRRDHEVEAALEKAANQSVS